MTSRCRFEHSRTTRTPLPGHVRANRRDVGLVFADRGDRLVGRLASGDDVERVAKVTATPCAQIE